MCGWVGVWVGGGVGAAAGAAQASPPPFHPSCLLWLTFPRGPRVPSRLTVKTVTEKRRLAAHAPVSPEGGRQPPPPPRRCATSAAASSSTAASRAIEPTCADILDTPPIWTPQRVEERLRLGRQGRPACSLGDLGELLPLRTAVARFTAWLGTSSSKNSVAIRQHYPPPLNNHVKPCDVRYGGRPCHHLAAAPHHLGSASPPPSGWSRRQAGTAPMPSLGSLGSYE